MGSRRARAMARGVAPRRRCAPGTFACGRSIRLAATTRPAMMRAALLGAMALVGAGLFASEAAAQCAGTSCVVTSSADTVNGNANPTLRDAITFANANPRHDDHVFQCNRRPDHYGRQLRQ